MKKVKGLQSIQQIMAGYKLEDKGKYITREFQDYGYRLAQELNDEQHTGLYIKLAKQAERSVLEQARIFVKGASEVRNRAKLFMWKLAELRRDSAK